TGTVVKGKQLGRTIGFPTANLCPGETDRKLVPANGVYACEVNIGDHSFPAMVNIGVRPSVDGGGASRSIEANIIGFGGNLYGTELSLKFIKRLRDEKKFDSLDALKSQLEKDRVATEAIMNAFCK
ncbi:MAG: riboflavin kinase, partial [Muribaculaceae bacterium]|nr:riboflavin kinase [Muribaculaceae bacterium]